MFDEWAADQDPWFKELFYTWRLLELKARARGKLVVAITHDNKYFHPADRLLKLEDGRLDKIQQLSGRRTDYSTLLSMPV